MGTILGGRWNKRSGLFLALVSTLLFSIPFPGVFCTLQVINLQSGQVMLSLPFFFWQRFCVSYIHSLYQTPVIEEFEAKGSTIHLRDISTRSWGVVEYYGIQGALTQDQGVIKVGGLDFKLPRLSLVVGYTADHRLTLGTKTYALYKMVEPGGILSIELHSISLGHYLWRRLAC